MARATSTPLAMHALAARAPGPAPRGRAASAAREPLPRALQPMLALLAAEVPPDQDNYSFEFKWDGIRAITYWDGKNLRIESRTQNDAPRRYPELQNLADALGNRRAVLDGEIV